MKEQQTSWFSLTRHNIRIFFTCRIFENLLYFFDFLFFLSFDIHHANLIFVVGVIKKNASNKVSWWVTPLRRELQPAAICWHFSYQMANVAFSSLVQHINITACKSDVTTFLRGMRAYLCGVKDRAEADRSGQGGGGGGRRQEHTGGFEILKKFLRAAAVNIL